MPTLLTVFSLLLHLLLSFILLYSQSLAILLPALFSPILLALAMSSLHLSVFSGYFLCFTYNETLNHTTGWLPHSYLVSMPSPSLAADYYCTPTLCVTTDLNLRIKQRANQMEQNSSNNKTNTNR